MKSVPAPLLFLKAQGAIMEQMTTEDEWGVYDTGQYSALINNLAILIVIVLAALAQAR